MPAAVLVENDARPVAFQDVSEQGGVRKGDGVVVVGVAQKDGQPIPAPTGTRAMRRDQTACEHDEPGEARVVGERRLRRDDGALREAADERSLGVEVVVANEHVEAIR
jgi:hypothetical protein